MRQPSIRGELGGVRESFACESRVGRVLLRSAACSSVRCVAVGCCLLAQGFRVLFGCRINGRAEAAVAWSESRPSGLARLPKTIPEQELPRHWRARVARVAQLRLLALCGRGTSARRSRRHLLACWKGLGHGLANPSARRLCPLGHTVAARARAADCAWPARGGHDGGARGAPG